ncbi:MAG: cold-shock protein [Halorhabdus sp.]
MSYRFDGSHIVTESPHGEFRVRRPFQRLLNTVSEEPVPDALVIIGVLTGQLRPRDKGAARHNQALLETTNNPPAATVSERTVDTLQWLLHEIGDELPADRKQRIGTVIETAGLHTPSEAAVSPASQQRGIDTGDRETNDEPLPDSHTEVEPTAPEPDGTALACEFCGTNFETESDLRSHWTSCESRPSDARFGCHGCGNTYIAEYALRKHREDCTERDRDQDGNEEQRRMTQAASPASHRCDDCGEEFDTRSALRAHAFTCDSKTRTARGRTVVVRGASGTVVHYDSDDGYGFISTPDHDGEQNVFFHVSDVPGNRCDVDAFFEFDIVATEDGYRAINMSRGGRGSVDTRPERFASDRAQWSRDT